jgi:hypothetical protein
MDYKQRESALPFTERCNPLSARLDGGLSPAAFLRTLRACDSQVFGGFEAESGLFDAPCLASVDACANACAALLSPQSATPGSVVMTGCGTSGRLAFLTARRYSALVPSARLTYAIAGGDSALLLSDEMPEDDAARGAADWLHAAGVAAAPPVLSSPPSSPPLRSYVIGVTCGLSAPYVAGQCMLALAAAAPDLPHGGAGAGAGAGAGKGEEEREGREECEAKGAGEGSLLAGAALLGFNPVSLARDARMCVSGEGPFVHSTFRGVAEAVAARAGESPWFSVINPVVGPEPGKWAHAHAHIRA